MTQSDIVMGSALPPNARRVLLGEQTASTLLANIVHMYRHHFGVVVGCAALPYVLPAMMLTFAVGNLKPGERQPALLVAAFAAFGLAYVNLFLVPAALTVVLSDICLGNAPTLKRAFSRVLGRRRWWHLFTTSILLGLAMTVGLILVIVPGVWLLVRTVFAVPVVVLEGRRNRDAIRRSFVLTKGQVWRLIGLFFLTFLLAELASILLGLVLGVTGRAVAGAQSPVQLYLFMSNAFIGFVLGTTVSSMLLVLLYYDQRVRHESYDAQALSEDLMR
jgi:uncharacterized membrane protein